MADSPVVRQTAVELQKGPLQAVDGSLVDRSEDSLALQFAEANADLRWVGDRGCWYHWDGKVWSKDSTLMAYDRIRELVRVIAAEIPPRDAANLKKATTISSIEKLSRSDRQLIMTADQFDIDQWLLNTPGGVVDLRDSSIRPHAMTDYLTKITKAAPGGPCPRWDQFLQEITDGDQNLIDFLKRMVGYALTGSVREHALFFLYGTGRNGKGVFLNTIAELLDEYAAVASMEMLTESRGDRHPTELASLQGRRLVVAQETDEGRRWAEAKIKTLTGGDPITARYMRGDFFTFKPQFKLLIAANHKPSLRNVDEAMRSRLHLIPFTVTIPKDKRDPDLTEKLRAEWSGILQWAINGALEYQEVGLMPPEAVNEATDEYFEDQDLFSQWLEECCETGPSYWETPSRLFSSWQVYAKAANTSAGRNTEFKDRLISAGFPRNKTKNEGRHHVGLQLKQIPQEDWRDGY